MPPAVRALALLVLCAVVLLAADSRAARDRAAGAGLVTRDGDTVEISDAAREAGLRFGPAVAPGDRAWVLAAVARARPEAARLIAEVDGLVEVRTGLAVEGAIGLTEAGPDGIAVTLDVAALNGAAALQRDTVVLHELGHVIDFALVPRALGERLDAGIPRGGRCSSPGDGMGACALAEERFADTFAKWALRGAVSAAGAGYAIPTPASLEDWGAPLGGFAAGLGAVTAG
jgi:hypothetical protein